MWAVIRPPSIPFYWPLLAVVAWCRAPSDCVMNSGPSEVLLTKLSAKTLKSPSPPVLLGRKAQKLLEEALGTLEWLWVVD